jgi:hypothetical protein
MGRPRVILSERICVHCGKKFQRGVYGGKLEDPSIFRRRQYCSHECSTRAKRKRDLTTRERDKHARELRADRCNECGSPKALRLHFLDGDKMNLTPGNYVTVCASCQTRRHWREGTGPTHGSRQQEVQS